MRTVRLFAAIAALGFAVAGPAHAQDTAQPEGTWAGKSTCTEFAGWCEDQDVVFHIRKDAQPLTYSVEMDVVSNGVETADSRLSMVYNTSLHTLTARIYDDAKRLNFWVLAVKGDSMRGVLMVEDRIIQRNLKLVRRAEVQPAEGGDASSSSASMSSAQ